MFYSRSSPKLTLQDQTHNHNPVIWCCDSSLLHRWSTLFILPEANKNTCEQGDWRRSHQIHHWLNADPQQHTAFSLCYCHSLLRFQNGFKWYCTAFHNKWEAYIFRKHSHVIINEGWHFSASLKFEVLTLRGSEQTSPKLCLCKTHNSISAAKTTCSCHTDHFGNLF